MSKITKISNNQLYQRYNLEKKLLFSEKVILYGWIKTIRVQSTMFFISLNDGSSSLNVQITGEINLHPIINKLNTGTAIQVEGIVVESPALGQSFEIQAENIVSYGEIENLSEYPIAKSKLGIDFLRTLPHLRSRTNFFSAVNRIRHSMMFATHLFYDKEGFYHLDPNILTVNECEGGAGVFTVTELLNKKVSEIPSDLSGNIDWSKDHFKQRVFLTVSSQLHLEGLAMAMSKVYTTNKSFRSEHSLTNKHVSEFAHLEIEQCFTTFEDLIDIAENYIKYVMKYVQERNKDDLNQLVQASKFSKDFVEQDFISRYNIISQDRWVRVKYSEAIIILEKNKSLLINSPPKYGEDMNSECEKFLTEYFKGPVFLTHWPQEIKSFYMKQLDDGTCESFDLLIPGIGELIGASQREEDYDKLIDQMKIKGIESEGLSFYTNLRKFGTAPHGGFGLGLDRFLMYLTGMKNIKDVIPYPVYYTSCNF
jgi:asparaginyl-tRNA synthetase